MTSTLCGPYRVLHWAGRCAKYRWGLYVDAGNVVVLRLLRLNVDFQTMRSWHRLYENLEELVVCREIPRSCQEHQRVESAGCPTPSNREISETWKEVTKWIRTWTCLANSVRFSSICFATLAASYISGCNAYDWLECKYMLRTLSCSKTASVIHFTLASRDITSTAHWADAFEATCAREQSCSPCWRAFLDCKTRETRWGCSAREIGEGVTISQDVTV